MKKTIHMAAAILAVSVITSGCVFAPGQNLLPKSSSQGGGDEPGVEVVVRPITGDVIAEQNSGERVAQLQDTLEELSGFKPEAYRIGAGDVLSITVWDHPELTAPAGTVINDIDANGRVIRADGTFFYPYAGTVSAAGKTVDELRGVLTSRLTKFIASPQIDVAVTRYGSQKVYLVGAFQKASALPVTTVPLSLPDALGQAGIDLLNADLSSLTLRRDDITYDLDLDAINRAGFTAANVMLKDGDQLQLPYADRKKVYVMGEVTRPQAVRFKLASISLADALLEANGLNQNTSKGSSVYVLRDRAGTDANWRVVDVYSLDSSSPESLVLADKFALQAGDMVYVGSAGITRWNRVISQLFPSASLLNTATDIKNN